MSATHMKIRPGTVVQVVGLSEGRMVCRVTTHWGLDRVFFSHHLDFGYEFRTGKGDWIPESDPRAIRFLERVRAEMLDGGPERHIGDYGHTLSLERVERVLRRNGWCEKRGVRRGPPRG